MIKLSSQSLLDNIEIAAPCSVSWESMTGDEKKRFCRHCRLNVYNISEMSSAEAQQLLFNSDSSKPLCVRLYRRFDGTVITKNCPVGLKKIRAQWCRFVQAIGAAVLWAFSFDSSVRADDVAPYPRRAHVQKRVVDFGVKPNVRPVSERAQVKDSATMGIVDYGCEIYMTHIQKRILAAWQTIGGFDLSKNRVVVVFKILKDGSVSSVRVLKSCGVTQFDAIAMESVSKAAPFRGLPGFASDQVDVEFAFDKALIKDFQPAGSGLSGQQ
jgi:TonB family protein